MTMKPRTHGAGRAAGADSVVARSAGPGARPVARFSNTLACIDGSAQAPVVLAWANAICRRLHTSLRTLHVLDTAADNGVPPDPITWEMRQIEARNRIAGLLEQLGVDEDGIAGIEVAVGPVQECLQGVLGGNTVDLCLIGAVGERAYGAGRTIADTARHIVETAPCSVLIVPPQAAAAVEQGPGALRRLLVPLDCSRRAEIALPTAIALADAFGAEIVIAHALPAPALTEIGPPDEAAIALRQNIADHNRKEATRYMSRLRARLALERRQIRTLVVNGSDPRHRLAQVAADEGADLIVMAAKGAGGYADLSLGSVTDFLVTHLVKPMVVVRPGSDRKGMGTVRSRAARPERETLAPGRN